MRILLIRTACWTRYGYRAPSLVLSPPLGILQLASYLRAYRRDTPQLIDLRLEPNRNRRRRWLIDTLRSFRPHVVGLSVLTHEYASAERIIQLTRGELPEAVVVVGGPHPSMYPRRALMMPGVDFIIQGEGEQAFCELLSVIEAGGDPVHLDGVGGRFNGDSFLNPPGPVIVDLGRLPMPAWDLYDPEPYLKGPQRMSLAHDFRPYAAVAATRGCPFRCSYCHNLFGKQLRKRPVAHVLEEIEWLYDRGIRSIEFYDDIINLDRDYMKRLLTGLAARDRDISISFPNGVRGDMLTSDDLRLFKAAGTIYMSIAVETASRRLQKQIRKHLDLVRVERNIRTAADLRIFTNGFFMFGFPTETQAEMKETLRFACRSKLHSALFFTVVPHPATDMGRQLGLDERDAPIDKWNYIMGYSEYSEESPEVVNRIQQQAQRRFYLSPSRALRVARDLPGKAMWARIVGGFIHSNMPKSNRFRWASNQRGDTRHLHGS